MTAKKEDNLQKIEAQVKYILDTRHTIPVGTEYPYERDIAIYIFAREDALIQQHEREIAILHADIAHAIGYCQGIGHPSEYLEKQYPDLAQQQSNGGKGQSATLLEGEKVIVRHE